MLVLHFDNKVYLPNRSLAIAKAMDKWYFFAE